MTLRTPRMTHIIFALFSIQNVLARIRKFSHTVLPLSLFHWYSSSIVWYGVAQLTVGASPIPLILPLGGWRTAAMMLFHMQQKQQPSKMAPGTISGGKAKKRTVPYWFHAVYFNHPSYFQIWLVCVRHC